MDIRSLGGQAGLGPLGVTFGLGPGPEEIPPAPPPTNVAADFLDAEWRWKVHEERMREMLAIRAAERAKVARLVEAFHAEVSARALGEQAVRDAVAGLEAPPEPAKIGSPAAALLLVGLGTAALLAKKDDSCPLPAKIRTVKSVRSKEMRAWGWVQVTTISARQLYEAGVTLGVLGAKAKATRNLRTVKGPIPSFGTMSSHEASRAGEDRVVFFVRAEVLPS